MRPVVVRLTAVSKAALNESCLIFALCETARFTGSKLMGAADISVSDADLDLLDAYLLSDQSPPECMLLSDLDGFLTGNCDRPGGGCYRDLRSAPLAWLRLAGL